MKNFDKFFPLLNNIMSKIAQLDSSNIFKLNPVLKLNDFVIDRSVPLLDIKY